MTVKAFSGAIKEHDHIRWRLRVEVAESELELVAIRDGRVDAPHALRVALVVHPSTIRCEIVAGEAACLSCLTESITIIFVAARR